MGADVARRAKGLGMNVIAHDPYAAEEKARALNVRLVGFQEAVETADFLSLHMPLTPGMDDTLSHRIHMRITLSWTSLPVYTARCPLSALEVPCKL